MKIKSIRLFFKYIIYFIILNFLLVFTQLFNIFKFIFNNGINFNTFIKNYIFIPLYAYGANNIFIQFVYGIIIILFILIYISFFALFNLIFVLIVGNNYNYPLYKQYFTLIFDFFSFPIFENSTLTYIYFMCKNKNIVENKLYWDKLFIDNNVNTPKIVGKIVNGNIIKYSDFNNNTEYIIKPIYGSWGNGIQKFNINNISKINKKELYIIQKKVIQNNINAHFRIISIYNKTKNIYSIPFVYLSIQEDKSKIASNGHNGGIFHEVDIKNDSLRFLKDKHPTKKLTDYFFIQLLEKSMNKALILHKKIDTIIIGWDVMLTDNNYYFLEGNFAPGNLFEYDYYYYEKYNKINDLVGTIFD